MGNRALIQFRHEDEVSPVIYAHYLGDGAMKVLVELHDQMRHRLDDISYIAARCVGRLIGGDTSDTGFGLWNATTALQAEHTHGDGGIFLVDVTKSRWAVTSLGCRHELHFPTCAGIDWTQVPYRG